MAGRSIFLNSRKLKVPMEAQALLFGTLVAGSGRRDFYRRNTRDNFVYNGGTDISRLCELFPPSISTRV